MINSFYQKQTGITLLEILLVLVILTAILFLSMQQYLIFRRDADVRHLQANVDTLFYAMGQYFRAHCKNDPFNTQASNPYQVVPLSTLITEGYLTLPNNANTMPLNPLVDDSTGDGYVLQLTQQPLTQRTVIMSDTPASRQSVGSINTWQIEVAVKLAVDQEALPAYQNVMAATCLSNNTRGYIQPCRENPDPSNAAYLLFERAPSFANLGYRSSYWLSLPTVKQFTQMYTTYPITVLTNNALTNQQYYVCGN